MCIKFILSLLQDTKNLFSEAAQGQPLKSLGLNTDPNVEKLENHCGLYTDRRSRLQWSHYPQMKKIWNSGEPYQEWSVYQN